MKKDKYQELIGTDNVVNDIGTVVAVVPDENLRELICSILNIGYRDDDDIEAMRKTDDLLSEKDLGYDDLLQLVDIPELMQENNLNYDDIKGLIKQQTTYEDDCKKIYSEIETHQLFIKDFLEKFKQFKAEKPIKKS